MQNAKVFLAKIWNFLEWTIKKGVTTYIIELNVGVQATKDHPKNLQLVAPKRSQFQVSNRRECNYYRNLDGFSQRKRR